MTIHPKYINRRKPGLSYIFEHRSNEFGGRICGVRFKAGISEPAKMATALRIAGAMGAKMLKVHCVETGETWGDRDPEPVRELRPRELSVRVRELVARAVACGAVPEEHASALVERVVAELGEPDVDVEKSLAEMAVDLDAHEARARAKLPVFEELATGDDTPENRVLVQTLAIDAGWTNIGWDADAPRLRGVPPEKSPEEKHEDAHEDEENPFSFADEVPLSGEPLHVERSTLEAMKKAQLEAWANEHLGMLLDPGATKAAMIDAILAHAQVVETLRTEAATADA